MKLFNILFYIILFIGFFLPSNSAFYIPFPGVLLSVNEVAFLLLPVVNLLCYSKNNVRFRNKNVNKRIVVFLTVIFLTEVLLKRFYFGQGFSDAFSSIRIGLPLFSSLILMIQGIRADVKIVWKVLLWAICSSVLLSLISLVTPLPIYYNLEQSTDLLKEMDGRISNANAAFGIIGLYLLFEDKNQWYNRGKLIKIACILSIVALIITFNRTYLTLMTLEVGYLVIKHFSVKKIMTGIFICAMFLGVGAYAYFNSAAVHRQIDKRIISIVFKNNTIAESAIEGNRSVIYESVEKRIRQGYWIIGLPYKIPIFTWVPRYGSEWREMTTTDTSFVNVLLRYGIVPMLLWLSILISSFWRNKQRILKLSVLVFALASLNTDALLKQNSIFFITILLFIAAFHNEKYMLCYKD